VRYLMYANTLSLRDHDTLLNLSPSGL